jgi:hypothetical protein
MPAPGALYLALELARTPILAKAMRQQPLPPDTLTLIRIAAGSTDTCRLAAAMTGLGADVIREAAVFYLQQMLLAADADNYRILGVAPDARQEDLREHMRWMMKWLHPDRARSDWDSTFAERVLAAWQEVKTPERRLRYDRSVGAAERGTLHRRGRTNGPSPMRLVPRIAGPRRSPPVPPRSRLPQRLVLGGVAIAVAAAVLLAPEWTSPTPGESADGADEIVPAADAAPGVVGEARGDDLPWPAPP